MATRGNLLVCIALFALSFGVRCIVWQNNRTEIARVQSVVTDIYKQDARLLVAGDLAGFISGPTPPSDATIIMHPPGYPVFIAAIYRYAGENEVLRIVQMLLCSLASIFIFLIAQFLSDRRTALIAGVLTAISPQFSYYSAIILPDELSAVTILASLYFLFQAIKNPRLWSVIFCGITLGVSCWLRANALLLPGMFAIAAFILLPKQTPLRTCSVLLATFLLVISPITIRNWMVFHSFVPLSLGTGTTFIEGLGDYDQDGRLGMPSTDEGVMKMDVSAFERPDYYGNLYNPDGIERERQRLRTGMSVVALNPGWYLASVAQRAIMTFRMERVPVIAPLRNNLSDVAPMYYYIDLLLKPLQRFFVTAIFLPLVVFGTIMLLRTNEKRKTLAILATVPIYYAIFQSLLHTEYRYLLPASHVLIILAAVPLGALAKRILKLNFQRSNS